MTDFEKIRLGRKYALGDGVIVDIEKAYELWKDVHHLLKKEDLETYTIIEQVLNETYSETSEFGEFINYAEVTPLEIEELDVRALFEKIMLKSKAASDFSKVYKALMRLENPPARSDEKKKKDEAFGKNISIILDQFELTVPRFTIQINRYSADNGLETRTPHSLYRVIGGKNGMSEGNMIQFVNFFNSVNIKRPRPCMKRDLTISDLFLPEDELLKLFYSPAKRKMDC